MSDDLLLSDRAEGVLTLTLNAPPAHPLSLAMIRALRAAIDAAASDPEARVILLHGPGRVFCAGHDLKEIKAHRADPDDGRAYLETLFAECGAMMMALAQSPRPTIALAEGVATAGGLQLLAACDMAFVTPAMRACLPGVSNGGFCSTPAVSVSRKIPRGPLMELALSGEMFDAVWCQSHGLVNRILPPEDLLPEVRAFARTLATRHAPAIALGKRTLDAHLAQPLDQAYAAATEAMLTHFMDPERVARDKAR
ncbi:enoyl-CoA hydratase-related protein [Mesobacterium pallidum]|uniref:enoyl-CoA hydratase-related protein n=1 Tax=Mesobacterium pallidum TaxID=2872037 RepID=UPI001EE27D62|nr:enoyl-CoA hydratase-related protein [Mesobacterium pallidum]